MTMEETILDNATRRERQLSFDIGLRGAPDLASVRIGGSMPIWRDLKQGERVHILITDMDGGVLVSYDGECEGVAFKTKKDQFGDVQSIERAHTVNPG